MSRKLAASPRHHADLDGIGLEALLQVALRMRPDELFLREPARSEAWTGRKGEVLACREIDERSRRLASLLAMSRLPERAQALVLAPAGAEQLISMLGALRAGLRPTLLPLSASPAALQGWIDMAGPSVAIGTSRCGDLEPARLLRDAAARSFNARLVCAFGPGVPDGAVPLDAVTTSTVEMPPPPAVTTPPGALGFTIETAYGERQQMTEVELMTATVEIARVAQLGQHGRLLSLMMSPSLLALATGPYLTLLTGAEYLPLGLFSLSALWAGLSDGKSACLVAPASLEGALRAAGVVGHGSVATVMLLHRARPAELPPAGDQPSRIVDLFCDGRNALSLSVRR